MPRIELADVRLAFDDSGEGERVLLLVHGHPFDRSMWRPQLEAAARLGCRMIAPDLRGYGESAVTPGKVTLETFARDLAALLDHLGVVRAAIGGLSMGGQIAMEFCRLFPARVEALLLAATFPRDETEGGRAQRLRTADRLEAEGVSAYAQELLPKMLAPETLQAQPKVAEKVLAMMLCAPAAGAAAALRGRAERPDYRETLARLDVPSLIVAGERDAFTTRSDAEDMQRLLRGSELLWLRGVGHMPNLEAEAAFNAAIEKLLNRAQVPGDAP